MGLYIYMYVYMCVSVYVYIYVCMYMSPAIYTFIYRKKSCSTWLHNFKKMKWDALCTKMVLVVKSLPANAGDVRDVGSIPGSGRSPGRGHGNPLQCSCLENPQDRGAWWATVHGVTKSDTAEWLAHSTVCMWIPVSRFIPFLPSPW